MRIGAHGLGLRVCGFRLRSQDFRVSCSEWLGCFVRFGVQGLKAKGFRVLGVPKPNTLHPEELPILGLRKALWLQRRRLAVYASKPHGFGV